MLVYAHTALIQPFYNYFDGVVLVPQNLKKVQQADLVAQYQSRLSGRGVVSPSGLASGTVTPNAGRSFGVSGFSMNAPKGGLFKGTIPSATVI